MHNESTHYCSWKDCMMTTEEFYAEVGTPEELMQECLKDQLADQHEASSAVQESSMHPFIEWLDAGRPSSMNTYDASNCWLEATDIKSRGASIEDLLYWLECRPRIYKDFDTVEVTE